MEQKYLPIGSVCTLKGKNKKIMVTGYYSVGFNGNLTIRDYCGCVYPEGMLLPEQNCIFNHSEIESIDFVGFKNEEYHVFRNLLDRLTGNDITEEEKASEFHKQNDMYLTSNSTYSKLLFDENGVVMIADTVESKKSEEDKYEFDSNGYIISKKNNKDITNPFYKEYEEPEFKEEKSNSWNIFNKIEFDENGTVVGTGSSVDKDKKVILNKLEFDENGTLISMDEERLEEEVPPIGPGLPGYVEPKNKKTSNYKFDEVGNVITEEIYEFDPSGNLVSMSTNEKEKEIPPIGSGLPGYVEPKNKKTSNYKFDEDGNVITEETYEFDPSGNLVSMSTNEKEQKYEFDENGTVVQAN